ncbi:hypothetical protein [Anaerorhabdus furcosa]|uniref:Uncharacterized protein n=1 Tax=Anaerorhabdus furcosa TaxID=118967 RepID=A0A1T4NK92_9FIRM|nr:hypothetical protein [Anaerorhabdus furcosa]SJZ79690.1 hypothetical protein SAMN02745191_1676 [Anaerorhabdus furcosa]
MKKLINLLTCCLITISLLLPGFKIFAEEKNDFDNNTIVNDLRGFYDNEYKNYTIYNGSNNIITEQFYLDTKDEYLNNNYAEVFQYMRDNEVWFEIDRSYTKSNATRAAVVEKYVDQTFNHPDYWGGASSGTLFTVKITVSGSYLYYPSSSTFSDINVYQSVDTSSCTVQSKSLTRTNYSSYIKFTSKVTVKDNGGTSTRTFTDYAL